MATADDDIKKIIVAELARDGQIDAAKITVDVQNGKVTLSGDTLKKYRLIQQKSSLYTCYPAL